jgi:HlyD family secretion protein
MKFIKSLLKIVGCVLLVVVLGGGSAFYYKNHTSAKPTESLRMATVQRGDLLSTISATGTLEPEEVVNVGSQVAGRIVEFGHDRSDKNKLVDYDCIVEEGDLLAKIDPVTYEVSLEQAKAALEQSEANVLQYEAKLKQAKQEWERAQSLLPKSAIAETDYDTAQYNFESAKSNVALGKAMVHQNQASVRLAEVNLGYCTIKSPVRGTIIDRRVNIGQTVVASLNAPSLFLIAKDLTKMQVWASVNEADIGRIQLDMPVRFTVDAHPGKTFLGTVTQIRKNAQMTQNVVTYMVIVTTNNSDGMLLPYLTASVQFVVQSKSDVLLVPNAALRWSPESSQIDPSVDAAALAAEPARTQEYGRVWVATSSTLVRPVKVKLGVTDGTMSEISGDDVKEGMRIVVGEDDAGESESSDKSASDNEQTNNPFTPKIPKGSKPPPGPM